MKVAIIEDELDSRGIIKLFLSEMFPDIKVVGEAGSVQEGLELLSKISVDVVLLDIQFPNGTGFDILQKLVKVKFEIIFITAYDQFAIDAIKQNAIDYLLKPLNREDFRQAIHKVTKKVKSNSEKPLVSQLLETLERRERRSLRLPNLQGFKLVEFESIIRCAAQSNYTLFFFIDGSKLVISKTMKEFEQVLIQNHFIRVHHSHIVNSRHIKEYIRGRGGKLIMCDSSSVNVSERRKESLLKLLK